MTAGRAPDSIVILEPDVEVASCIRTILAENQVSNPVYHIAEAKETERWMGREGKYQNAVRFPDPCLVFLDVNLAGEVGGKLIDHIATSRSVPVVLLATLAELREVQRGMKTGAAGFLLKLDGLKRLLTTVDLLPELETSRRRGTIVFSLVPTAGRRGSHDLYRRR